MIEGLVKVMQCDYSTVFLTVRFTAHLKHVHSRNCDRTVLKLLIKTELWIGYKVSYNMMRKAATGRLLCTDAAMLK